MTTDAMKILVSRLDELLPILEVKVRQKFSQDLLSAYPAEDIVQDTAVRVLRSDAPFEFRDDASTINWLARVSERLALDFLRKRSREINSTLPAFLVDSGILTPSAIMKRGEQEDAVAGAIKQLSANHQLLLRLRYEEGLTFNAIAESLRTTASAVRGQHRNALKAAFRLFEASGLVSSIFASWSARSSTN